VAAADWLLAGARAVERHFPIANCLKGGTYSVAPELRHDPRQAFLAAVSAYTIGVKVADDLTDQGSWKARLAHVLYRDTFARARRDLAACGFELGAFEEHLSLQRDLEARNENDLNAAAAPSGNAFALVARHLADRHGAGVAGDDAAQLGACIGRSVFLIDAQQDLDRDVACCSYNPLRVTRDRKAPADAARRREAAVLIRGLLAEAAAVCGRLGEQVARRWRAAAASLEMQVSHGSTDLPPEDPPPSDEPPGWEEAREKRPVETKAPSSRVSCPDSVAGAASCCELICCCAEVGSCL
jgi:hypothetical protein